MINSANNTELGNVSVTMYTLSCISLSVDQKVDTVCYHKEMNENMIDGKKIK